MKKLFQKFVSVDFYSEVLSDPEFNPEAGSYSYKIAIHGFRVRFMLLSWEFKGLGWDSVKWVSEMYLNERYG